MAESLARASRLVRRPKPRPPKVSALLPVTSWRCRSAKSRRIETNKSPDDRASEPGLKGKMVMAGLLTSASRQRHACPTAADRQSTGRRSWLVSLHPHQHVHHVPHGGHDAGIRPIGHLESDELRHLLIDIDPAAFGVSAL